MSKFNLPTYVKGKSFSEASALIAKRFEDRNSPEDVATLNDLQGRLQQAQEFVKSEQESKSKPQHQMPDGSMMDGASHQEGAPAMNQPPADERGAVPSGAEQLANEYYGGGRPEVQGLAGGLAPVGVQNVAPDMAAGLAPKHSDAVLTPALGGAESATAAPGLGAYASAATGALDLAKTAFGDPGIDTSGATAAPEVPSIGGSAASGAMKGAKAGMAFGPWGAAIGGVLGGAAGLIGGGKAQKAADTAERNFAYNEHNQASNSYHKGGKQDHANNYYGGGSKSQYNEYYEGGPDDDLDPMAPPTGIDFMAENDAFMNRSREGQPRQDLPRPRATAFDIDSIGVKDVASYGPQSSDIMTNSQSRSSAGDDSYESSESKYNPGELLRYAPAVMNAGQLAGLQKPGKVGLDRLTDMYRPQQVDERGMQNAAQNAANINKDAILSSSGGSASAARAALLGSELNASRNLSGAYQAATAENRQDNRKAQEFNTGVNRTNLQQSNQEKNLNLEQQAAYRTNKSKLLSQIGNDLGGVGKEEMLKMYPELMGLNYDYKGKHKSKNKKKDKEDKPGK
tara:strand:+ start:369 stop:2072 length:1704 start_codon:yes stop_codon:yes gene_type:complete